MPPLARQPRNRQALYAIYRQLRCARRLPAVMCGRRIVRVIFSLICDGGAFPSGSTLSVGKSPFPGGESRSSGIPGAVARNGASLSSPRLSRTSPVGPSATFDRSCSAKAEVEAIAAMMHRAALIAVSLSINPSCEGNQEQGGLRVDADAGGRSSDSQRSPWNEQPARRLRRTIASIGQAFGQPIDLETAVRVKRHLNNGRDFEPHGDRWSERGAKHPGAAPGRFHPE